MMSYQGRYVIRGDGITGMMSYRNDELSGMMSYQE